MRTATNGDKIERMDGVDPVVKDLLKWVHPLVLLVSLKVPLPVVCKPGERLASDGDERTS